MDKWVWAAATESQVQPPGIVQPIQHYLPLLHATFVMGGATTTINPMNGTFTQCNVFNAGYLIKATGSATDMASSIPVTNVELHGSLPTPRMLACTVVLSNGDVFMYGGATPNETLNDAWILNTRSWTWSNIRIKGLPVSGRAGSTCQMATVNQLIVVGVHSDELQDQHGYDMSPNSTVRTSMIPFTQLGGSVATTQGRGQLPWPESLQQEQEQKQYFLQHQQQQQNPQRNRIYSQKHSLNPPKFPQPGLPLQSPVVVKQLSSAQATTLTAQQRQQQRHSNQSKKPSSPFLIIPYVPDDSAFSTSSSAGKADSASLGMSSTLYDSQISPNNNSSSSTTSTSRATNNSNNGSERRKLGLTDLPESTRMPHTLADMHHGQYVKTLQHHKQYERRRQEELRLNSGLVRAGTQESISSLGGNIDGYDDEEDDLGLATGVLRLREVDLGEESISGSVNGLEAGTILLSSHLETSALESEDISSEWQ
ncbi:hypothetical protein BGZ81_010165 [Podila clonocystis]|nr:hypothetical protein BGZ81_010165 [Podila clonocystis]